MRPRPPPPPLLLASSRPQCSSSSPLPSPSSLRPPRPLLLASLSASTVCQPATRCVQYRVSRSSIAQFSTGYRCVSTAHDVAA
eukprot:3428618-Rhodomonas_salina.3